jgi:hypothetical protein
MSIDTIESASTGEPPVEGTSAETAVAEAKAGRSGKGARRATGRARAPNPEKASGRPAKGKKPAVKADRAKGSGKTAKETKALRRPTDKGKAGKPRTGTKQETLIAMLRRPEGATIDEIVAATDWQKHTVRGAISGALKKKHGLTVESEKVEGRGRVYRITG